MSLRIKICCILDEHEARLAVAAGADALGFVAEGLSGPEVRPLDHIARVIATLPPWVSSVLLTKEQDPEALIDAVRLTGATTLQLCDDVAPGTYEALKAAHPYLRILQVVHMNCPGAVEHGLSIQGPLDALLLDSGWPLGETPVFGGTGETHDWALSAELVQRATVPVILAGGLREDNLARALATVKPWGIDLCSGVRTDGRLDPSKLAIFIRLARTIDA